MVQKQKQRIKRQQEELDNDDRSAEDSKVQHYREQAMETVDEYPIAATFGAFGIGIGLGVLIGCSLAGSPPSRMARMERHAESLGRKILESLSDMVPNSLRS